MASQYVIQHRRNNQQNALYSRKNVSQKNMNYAEAVIGAGNDVGLPAAAKPASPGANSRACQALPARNHVHTDAERARK